MASEVSLKDQPHLLHGIVDDVQTLLHQELELASLELKRDARTLSSIGAQLSAAALLGLLGVGLLALALVHLMVWWAPSLPLWGAYGITALGFSAIGGLVARGGVQRWHEAKLGPRHTIQSMKENEKWLKTHM